MESGARSISAGVEDYFSRKYNQDLDFALEYDFMKDDNGLTPFDLRKRKEADAWERKRKEFFRYYSIRAGAGYSLGSHDEWNIFVRLNARRLNSEAYGPGELMAGFFEGQQIDPASAEREVSKGYEESPTSDTPYPGQKHPAEVAWPSGLLT